MDHTKPLITTIIPTYKRPKLLQRAIRSVLNQSYPNFEVLVCDNASNDETASVVAEIAKKDPRVKYRCNKTNIGIYPNFQSGMDRVKTPYFSFLSDDDILLPDFYKIALEGFKKYPEAIFSAGSTIYMSDKGEVKGVAPGLFEKDGFFTPHEGIFQFLSRIGPSWTSTLFRKEVIEKVGGFDLDPDLYAIADADLQLRIASRFSYAISKEPCAIYVLHNACYSASGVSKDMWPGWLKITKKIYEDTRISPEVREQTKRIMEENTKKDLFNIWVAGIRRKNFTDGYRIADILQETYGQKTKARLIRMSTKLFEIVPFAYDATNNLVSIGKFLRQKKTQDLQKRFGEYARFLEIYAESK